MHNEINNFQNASTIISNTKAYIHEMKNRNTSCLIGLDTGYTELNKMTAGFNKGELILIGARPCMGSTSLALNITNNLLNEGKGIAIISLEMSAEEIMLRLISIQTFIHLQRLRLGKMDTEDHQKLNEAMDTLESKKLFIHDQNTIDIDQICTKLRELKNQNPALNLAIVDSLQAIRSSHGEMVGEISRKLKMLALELEIPIVILSKLSSKLELRANKRPILSDIPEADMIEPYVDTVLFLYRHDFYLYNQEKEREQIAIINEQEFISCYVEKEEEEAEIIIAKQRSGEIGRIKLWFQKKFTRFIDRPVFWSLDIVYESVN